MASKTSNDETKYSFLVEWLDTQASIVRKYNLFYHLLDGSIEMYDVRNRRTFLKKCQYPSIALSDIFIGATISVYSRQLRVVEYCDDFTRKSLEHAHSKALSVIKPDGTRRLGEVLDAIFRARLTVSNLKMTSLTQAQACEFYGTRTPNAQTQALLGGPVTAIEVIGENAAAKMRHILHQIEGKATSDPLSASQQIFAASAQRDPQLEFNFFFRNPNLPATARFSDCSVCVVKPHAVQAGQAGFVVTRLLDSGFQVTAAQLFSLDKAAASEFLEVYQTVLPEYNALVDQMASGPCIALEVCRQTDTVQALRELCGPSDPHIAKVIRPGTIRAELGRDKVLNGVHCTDLVEDGPLESEFFFSILQGQ